MGGLLVRGQVNVTAKHVGSSRKNVMVRQAGFSWICGSFPIAIQRVTRLIAASAKNVCRQPKPGPVGSFIFILAGPARCETTPRDEMSKNGLSRGQTFLPVI